MAEAIGLASGLLALSTFALKSGISLAKTIQSYKNFDTTVRDLQGEVEALVDVLGPLVDLVRGENAVDLSALDIPLLRCATACKDFNTEIVRCSSRSEGGRESIRDWARLKYMGDDIDGFRRLLAGYKSTIVVAMTDANLRAYSLTVESIKSYKTLVETTTRALEQRLEAIDDKLEAMRGNAAHAPSSDLLDLRAIREERKSTRRCLEICRQLSQHIDQVEITSTADCSRRCTRLRTTMISVQIMTPPRRGSATYSCIVDFDNKPYEVHWSGSQQYPDMNNFPDVDDALVVEVVQDAQIAMLWNTSSLVDFGSHASIRAVRCAHPEGFPMIKLAHPDEESERLIQHEFTILQALKSNKGSVVKTYGTPIKAKGRIYGYRMEELWPMSHVEQKGRASDIGDAVRRLHLAGYEHRDLSPSNIMNNQEGEVVLIDFSSAVRATGFPTDEKSLRDFWGIVLRTPARPIGNGSLFDLCASFFSARLDTACLDSTATVRPLPDVLETHGVRWEVGVDGWNTSV